MSDAELFPTPTRLALLADVRDLKVYDDPAELVPYLDLGDGLRARVAAGIWQFESAGWVYRPADAHGWRLTQRGLDVLEGRR